MDAAAQWKEMLVRTFPFPGRAQALADERPPHHILAVFVLIVCDEQAFDAVYKPDGSFDRNAIFTLNNYQGKLENLSRFMDTIKEMRGDFQVARKAWRALAQDYEGTACPDRDSLANLADFTKKFGKP